MLTQTNQTNESQAAHRAKLLARLKRAEGQLRGVIQMVETTQSCENIAPQFSAVRKALDRAFYEMVSCWLLQEITLANQDNNQISIINNINNTEKKLAEIAELLSKYG